MQVVVIKRHTTDSWAGPPPIFVAVAENEYAAKQWIQDEVDGKHNSGCSYASGQSADWWIEYGTFSLMWVEVQKDRYSSGRDKVVGYEGPVKHIQRKGFQ